MPAASGASGPTTVRPIWFCLANWIRPADVRGGEVDVLGVVGRARVARRDEDLLDPRALANLPCQGMLAAAAANDKHIHSVASPWELLDSERPMCQTAARPICAWPTGGRVGVRL